jgi:hypothetical protein
LAFRSPCLTRRLQPVLYGYSDSDLAADLNNCRSTSGFVFLLNGGPISWKSKQQSLVTSSTHDAEYVDLASASHVTTWKVMLAMLPDYIYRASNTIQYTILRQSRCFCCTYAVSSRSKHIDVRFHITRDAAANGLIRLEYVRTTDMTADILQRPCLRNCTSGM